MGRIGRVFVVFVLFALGGAAPAGGATYPPRTAGLLPLEVRSLDGSGNNRAHPTWGKVGTAYRRLAPPRYADRVGAPSAGTNARYVSNRVFNDLGQDIFSERNLSQWAWTWGQFMDHTFGLALGSSESNPIAFTADPLEAFRNDIGSIPFKRDAAASGTGGTWFSPRQQINTVSSYIDGWSVYGGSAQRLEWLREGPVDGNLANNGARLLVGPDGYLPRANSRGDASTAPTMAVDGQLTGHPQDAAIAGDVRGNENIALTAVHTLFAREHNRIVNALPAGLTEEQKFQIARRVVGAEQQYITYNEFLPALGLRLSPYAGYRPYVNASLGNEFATVAYRAHSMIHGSFEVGADADAYTTEQLEALESAGVEVEDGEAPGEIVFDIPLNVAFFNPDLVPGIGVGRILKSLSDEPQYKNDEQIDNALRSVLFQFPGPDTSDPAACFEDPSTEDCFQAVVDLGAIDIQRGRDHGMPTYNQLRLAVGLPAKRSFKAITGEATEQFPDDPEIDVANPIDDPDILDFVDLRDAGGDTVPPDANSEEQRAVVGVRRTTLAARMKAIYGSVDKLDAFVGMMAEAHAPGTEFGPLQRSIWKQQFEALRDGDRFFYRNDPVLDLIKLRFGITYRHRLSELIALDAGVSRADLPANVFFGPAVEGMP